MYGFRSHFVESAKHSNRICARTMPLCAGMLDSGKLPSERVRLVFFCDFTLVQCMQSLFSDPFQGITSENRFDRPISRQKWKIAKSSSLLRNPGLWKKIDPSGRPISMAPKLGLGEYASSWQGLCHCSIPSFK